MPEDRKSSFRINPIIRVSAVKRTKTSAISHSKSQVTLNKLSEVFFHRFKFENRPALAEPLAGILLEAWHANPLPVDIVTAVPLHVARERERGYNQANLLAREFAGLMGKVAVTDILLRVRNTRTQVGLSAADREKNVRGAFACVAGRGADQSASHTFPPAKHPAGATTRSGRPSVQGKQVLVIDDVCTTGATLEACSVALKAAGAIVVYGLTLARPA